jgi:hypothetical protein
VCASVLAADHRRISAMHLIREAERWNALGTGEAERIVTATLAAFAEALDHVTVPSGVPAMATSQLAWNVERLQAGDEIGQRSSGYRGRCLTISRAYRIFPAGTTGVFSVAGCSTMWRGGQSAKHQRMGKMTAILQSLSRAARQCSDHA